MGWGWEEKYSTVKEGLWYSVNGIFTCATTRGQLDPDLAVVGEQGEQY